MAKKSELDLSHILVELSGKSDEELKSALRRLSDEEDRVSFRRRVLHGQIDIIKAELVRRLKSKSEQGESLVTSADIERLSEILAKGPPGVTRSDMFDEDDLT